MTYLKKEYNLCTTKQQHTYKKHINESPFVLFSSTEMYLFLIFLLWSYLFFFIYLF
jgi:hypothetical protein